MTSGGHEKRSSTTSGKASCTSPMEVVHEAHNMSTTTNCPRTQATAGRPNGHCFLLSIASWRIHKTNKSQEKWQMGMSYKNCLVYCWQNNSLICDFYDETSVTFSMVQAQHVQDMVKAMVVKLNLTEKGMTPVLVGTHSLRAGGAIALKLHGYDNTTIMKMGRWTSLTFTMYIHNQIAHLSAGVSRKMGEKLPFLNIAASKNELCPTYLSSKSATLIS